MSDERSVIRADTITTVTADDDPDDSIVEDDEEDDAEVAAEFEAENGGSRTAERKTAANGAGESGDDRPSRKRRRRRRRRRDGAEGADDDRPSQEASGDRTSGRSFDGDDSDDGDDDDATGNIDGDINGDDDISDGARTAEPIDSADGEDRPKRRRRGRRGGRRRRGQGEDAETPAVNGVDGDEAQGDYVSAADDEPYFGPDMGDDAEFEPERRDDLGVGSHAASADAGPVADLIYPADEGASAPRPTAKHAEAQSTDDPSDVSEGEARGGIGAAASAAPTADEIAERLKNRNPTRKGWWSRAFGG